MTTALRTIDPFYLFSPWLYGVKDDCDEQNSTAYHVSDSPYFDGFTAIKGNIENYNEEDLRTISYLARNYRDRVAYDPKNIDRYFQSMGLLRYDKTCFDVVCCNIDCPCDIDKDIPYSVWKTLEDGRIPRVWKMEEKGSIQRRTYIDSFDTPSAYRERETPMK